MPSNKLRIPQFQTKVLKSLDITKYFKEQSVYFVNLFLQKDSSQPNHKLSFCPTPSIHKEL